MRRRQRTGDRDIAVLSALGAALVASIAALGFALSDGLSMQDWLVTGPALALYVVAAIWTIRMRLDSRRALVVVLAVALLARLALVAHEPTLSTDVYRYVWDGRVQVTGINPYRHVPASPALAALRDGEVFPRINRKQKPPAYPPGAELAFGAISAAWPDGVLWMKLALSLADVAAVALLAAVLAAVRWRPERAILYAWHPLAIVEVGYSGHVEALVVLAAAAALYAAVKRRRAMAGALLAAGVLVKPYALALAPALAARAGPRGIARMSAGFAAVLVLAYLPFLTVGTRVLGYLPGYLTEEGFVDGFRFHLLAKAQSLTGSWGPAATTIYLAACAALLVGLSVWAWRSPMRSPSELPQRAQVLFLAVLVLMTPGYPWYRMLALALLPFCAGALLVAAGIVASTGPLLYVYTWTASKPAWPLDVVHLGSAAAVVLALAWMGARRGPGERPTLSFGRHATRTPG